MFKLTFIKNLNYNFHDFEQKMNVFPHTMTLKYTFELISLIKKIN